MQTQVTFRHLKSRPELHDAAIDAADKFVKFYDQITNTNVEFIAESKNIVEFKVHVHGNTLVVRESSEDFMKSLNLAEDKMVRQLRKHKSKFLK